MAPVLLTLYGRAWCHLCDEMLAALEPMLAGSGTQVVVIDIDTDPLLEARYNDLVPVLVCGGVELCHYRLDESAVRAMLPAHTLHASWGSHKSGCSGKSGDEHGEEQGGKRGDNLSGKRHDQPP